MSISITIHDLDERADSQLRARAASHGRSVEDEARQILRAALGLAELDHVAESSTDLATAIRAIVEPFGGFKRHELPPFDNVRESPHVA